MALPFGRSKSIGRGISERRWLTEAEQDAGIVDRKDSADVKKISLIRSQFPPPNNNGASDLQYTHKALLRAVIAAGLNPKPGGYKTTAENADINMRINAILSAVDTSGSSLTPTPVFLGVHSGFGGDIV